MKTNGSMVLWKKSALFLFYIGFAFFSIAGWQLSEVSAETQTCTNKVDIPDEVEVVKLFQNSQEKKFTNESDEHWFKYYFTNEEDDTNPDGGDTNGEDHSIEMIDVKDFDDLSILLIWEVYDRDGNCVATGLGDGNDRFGPSAVPYTVDNSLPSDIYFIRIIWKPEEVPAPPFEEITFVLLLNGTAVPRVDGFIKDAFSGEELKDVKVKNNETQIDIDSDDDGYYALDTPDGNNPLEYDLDGYDHLIIDFEVKKEDFFPQDVILCPNDVDLTATPTSGDAPLEVTFDLPDVTHPDVEPDFDWDFGDGMSSDSPDPVSNTYFDPGTYKVNVTVSLTLPTSDFVTEKVECTVTSSVDVIVGIDTIFADVPLDYWAKDFIEKIYLAGITSGCAQNPLKYCPEKSVTRAEMAVFLERGINGSDYDPDDATGTLFDDVTINHRFADWIEQFYADGITSGCSTDPPLYCPDNPVKRDQMAVFLLRSMYGEDYTPPSAVGIFDDVPVIHGAANWIEQLYDEGITGGCVTDPPLYCPDGLVTRAEMAVLIVRAFEL